MPQGTNIYPEFRCMVCWRICTIYEEVSMGDGDYELWCYCKKCEEDTFYRAIDAKDE